MLGFIVSSYILTFYHRNSFIANETVTLLYDLYFDSFYFAENLPC